MGNYASKRKKVGYSELRESIPGSLVSDHDFDLFYSLCRIESVRTISTLLHPSSTQLFFVVISGEVQVHLSNTELKSKPFPATVYRPGEVIHFFNIPLKSNSVVANIAAFESGECLQSGNVKMSLHFANGMNSTARVIGMDRTGLNEFLITAQNNTHALRSFLELTVSELPTKSPFFKTITPDQMSMLGPLIKVRLSHVGSVISPYTTDMAIQCQRIGTELSPKSRKEPSAANYGPAGEVALLFSGSALSVPFERNLAHITHKLQEQNAIHQSHNHMVHRTNSLLPLTRLYQAPKGLALSSLPPPIFYPTPPPHPQPGDSDKSSNNATERARIHVTILPGTFMGLSEFYCRDPRVVPRACVISAPSVVGYLDLHTLDALFSVDPRFERVIKRNYHMLVMSWLKPTVPLLRDMDEWSFALLSCKVFIKCYLENATIYKKGEPSDYAYIMLCGSVKEVTDSGSPKNATPTVASGKLKCVQIERIMNWGTLFGEVALATNNPYFNTTTTQEPTMVLCISKHVLEQIYNNNKTKLCEIRIRLLGGDATLQHVVDHPRGCQLFQAYLDKEMAGENLRFYNAVDRYDAMCREVLKQYNTVVKLRTENAELLNYLLSIQHTNAIDTTHTAQHNNNNNHISTATQGNELARETHETHGTQESLEEKLSDGLLTLLSPHSVPDRMNKTRNSVESDYSAGSLVDVSADNISGILRNSLRNSVVECNDNNVVTDYVHPDLQESVHYSGSVPTEPYAVDNTTNHYYEALQAQLNATNSTTASSTCHNTIDGSAPNIALSQFPVSVPNSTQSSFAISSTKTSVSDKSMIHYMSANFPHSDSVFNTKHSSIDMTAYGNENEAEERVPDQEHSSTKDSVMSYGSMRSVDSNKSDHFIQSMSPHTHSDANHKNHNPALTQHNLPGANAQNHTHNHQNHHSHHNNHHNKAGVVKRPALESIISESNFSVISSEQDEQDGSAKFSLKVKPTPQGSLSAAAYSTKIAPLIEENEDEYEPDIDDVHDGARAGGTSSPFTLASIRKAMQYATSMVVEGSNSAMNSARREDTYGLSPRRANSNSKLAVSPKHNSLTLGTLPALPPSQYDTPTVVKEAPVTRTTNDITNVVVADGATTIAVTTVVDPEKAKEVARNITQKLHRIQKNIVELKQVARSIMQTYIYNGSEHQLNLPDALRIRTEKGFKVWSTSLMASVTTDSYDERESKGRDLSVKVTASADDDNLGSNANHSTNQSTNQSATAKPVYNKFGSLTFIESIIPGGLQIVTNTDAVAESAKPNAQPYMIGTNDGTYASVSTADRMSGNTNPYINTTIHNNTSGGIGITGTSPTNFNPFTPLPLRINTDTTRSASGIPMHFLNSESIDTLDTGFGSIQPLMAPVAIQYPHANANTNASANTNTNSTSSYNFSVPMQTRTVHAPSVGASNAPLPIHPNTLTNTKDTQHLLIDPEITIDLSFVDLFKETKAEILRLLRDDKFPRFKNTAQFVSFLANVKPYEKENLDNSLVRSGHDNRYSQDFDLSR